MAQRITKQLYHVFKIDLLPITRPITSTTKYLNLICWKCGAERREMFLCEKCNIIQKPSKDDNYFRIFGIQEKFDIDQTQLTKQFRQLQNIVHPDKFGNKYVSINSNIILNFDCLFVAEPMKRNIFQKSIPHY